MWQGRWALGNNSHWFKPVVSNRQSVQNAPKHTIESLNEASFLYSSGRGAHSEHTDSIKLAAEQLEEDVYIARSSERHILRRMLPSNHNPMENPNDTNNRSSNTYYVHRVNTTPFKARVATGMTAGRDCTTAKAINATTTAQTIAREVLHCNDQSLLACPADKGTLPPKAVVVPSDARKICIDGSDWKILDNGKRSVFVTMPGNIDVKSLNIHTDVRALSDKFVCGFVQRLVTKQDKRKFLQRSQLLHTAIYCKPDQARGTERNGVNRRYVFHGMYKGQRGIVLEPYSFNKDVPLPVQDYINKGLAAIVSSMEKHAKVVLETMLPRTTRSYRSVRDLVHLPTIGDNTEVAVASQTAIGLDYAAPAHRDLDYFYSTLTVYAPPGLEVPHNTVLYYFCFPELKLKVPLCAGDVLVFNPRVTHCVSNSIVKGSIVMSAYTSTKTMYTAASNILPGSNKRKLDKLK